MSNNLWGSDVLLFPEFINIASILSYNFITLLKSLHCYILFLVISFAWYKEYIICLISFSKFSDVLPAFTCANASSNLWSICLGVNILSCLHSKTLQLEPLAVQAKSERIFPTILTIYIYIFWFLVSGISLLSKVS